MTDHPSDDFDEMLHDVARDYNRPSDVPRERMWSAIQTARARRTHTPVAPWRTRRVWLVPAAAAAVLLIGIAIGRAYEHWSAAPNARAVATTKPDSVATPTQAPVKEPPGMPNAVADATHRADTIPPEAPRSTPNAPRSTPKAQRSTHSEPFAGNSASMAYQLAVVEHLAGTEAMLTSFRAAARHGEVDAQITAWARNLLTTTRLLQASAADDPTMKRLLDDLELVLVQIAQYRSAGPHRAEELELIEHSIERRGVIGKLHTNTPARFQRAGT